ncbi:hypothetical protein ENBRE01_1663 [Enteropsectra breve]|nr:hypothetical protein ENBRE01_1663 [Enteropsectra breve]
MDVKLKINIEKIQLMKKEIKLLGMRVDGETVTMPEEMREKILEFSIPKTKNDLQKFLGAINYHRRFIDNYGEKTLILYELLKENHQMEEWSEDHTAAFTRLQDDANKNVVRFHPNYDLEFVLETDASNYGVGAILYQIGNDGEKRIIKPIASKLKKNELNWGITEKELYAIVWAIEKLDMYLWGRKFIIYTDHKAATWLKSKENFGNARIQRWLERLQYYNFELCYRKGEEMAEPDVLSRLDKPVEDENPSPAQREIIYSMHTELGHRGPEVVKYAIKKEYTAWPNLDRHIKIILQGCETCAMNKVKTKGGSEFIESKRKMQIIGVDILEYKSKYYLLGIDFYTRKMFGSILNEKSAESIVQKLTQWFKKFGNPEILIVDHGLEFMNKKVEELCFRRDIQRNSVSIEHHQGNGRVERLNRTIREYFRKNEQDNTTREELLGRAISVYNNSYHSAIKMTPDEAWGINETSEILNELNKRKSAYAKKFKKLKREKFVEGQIVRAKSIPYHKDNVRYEDEATVIKKLRNDAYLIKNENKIQKRNHTDLVAMP